MNMLAHDRWKYDFFYYMCMNMKRNYSYTRAEVVPSRRALTNVLTARHNLLWHAFPQQRARTGAQSARANEHI